MGMAISLSSKESPSPKVSPLARVDTPLAATGRRFAMLSRLTPEAEVPKSMFSFTGGGLTNDKIYNDKVSIMIRFFEVKLGYTTFAYCMRLKGVSSTRTTVLNSPD
jgi:hypothetical protein